MLGAVTRINHPLAAISVEDHSSELIICTGRGVALPTVAVPAAKKRCTGVAPERLQFKLQKTREAL